MTRDQAIEYASYYLKEDIREGFEIEEWNAATKDLATFCVYNNLNYGVKVITTVENDELKYDVLFIKEGN